MRQTQKEIDFYTAISNTDKVRNLDYKNEKDYRRTAPKSVLLFLHLCPQTQNLHDPTLQAKQKQGKTHKNPKIQSNKQRI